MQLRVRPDQSVELLSLMINFSGRERTELPRLHFPADPAYSRLISEPAITIGERLARRARWAGSHLTSW